MHLPATAIAAAAVLCCPAAHGEKVIFRGELTGCEMWRLSDYSAFHEYCHAAKPFSSDGRRIVFRQWRADGGIVVTDLADGSEVVFGREHRGWKENPAFLRGANAVVYIVGRQDAPVFLYDLDRGAERRVVQLSGAVQMPAAGVIGPRSEYLLLRGDLNGDGLSDFGVKSLRSDEPPRALLWFPHGCAHPHAVSPSPDCNRLTMVLQTCHPDLLRRLRDGERLTPQQLAVDARYQGCIAVVDMDSGAVKTYPARGVKLWSHETWSGDGQYVHMAGCSWPAGRDAPSAPIRIGDAEPSDHYGTCGRSGRYVAGDSEPDGMERLELTDLWTGEMRTVAYISAPTEPAGKIIQDHGHPAGSPDGTKVLFHSCYDLVNHRLYAIPTEDVCPGDAVIPVETTEGFARPGRLLIGHGYVGQRISVSYQHTDATHFYGCEWPANAAAGLRRAIRADRIVKGSHHITDAGGRLFPDGACRPRKEYIAVVKRPDPPRALRAASIAARVRLSWNAPASHEETAGYVVWRRRDGGSLERLTADPLTSCAYVDAQAGAGKVEYTVQAVEHCGLYGDHSSVAWIDEGREGVELVDSYDVPGSAYVSPGEVPASDRRRVRFSVPLEDRYLLWVRGRASGGAETLRVQVDGRSLPDATFAGVDWGWTRVASCRLTAGEHVLELAADATYDIRQGNLLRNPGFEQGLQGWSCREAVTSVDGAAAHSGSRSVKLSGMLAGSKLAQALDVDVKPEWTYRLAMWIRGRFTHSEVRRPNGPHPHTPGRFAMVLEPLPYPHDWYRDGNQFDADQWQQIEIVFHSPPQSSAGRWSKRLVAQPFWCPDYWGAQAGTLWIDDVSLTELGPRLRPVKATRLLVTNLPAYVPQGLDGRAACPRPPAPLIPVTGLRQTGRTADGVTLAWDAGRWGTRGYNVHLRAGAACPATKYFQRTTVCGKTSVNIAGLSAATSYSVAVSALNEDGIPGPAATIRAGPAPPPQTHSEKH